MVMSTWKKREYCVFPAKHKFPHRDAFIFASLLTIDLFARKPLKQQMNPLTTTPLFLRVYFLLLISSFRTTSFAKAHISREKQLQQTTKVSGINTSPSIKQSPSICILLQFAFFLKTIETLHSWGSHVCGPRWAKKRT